MMAAKDQGATLSESEQEALSAYKEALAERVEALGKSLVRKRQEAIDGRKNSGIEEEWSAAEDAYQGVDSATQGQRGKPSSPHGGFVNSRTDASNQTRSTVVLNITRPYVDAAAARVGDMLLPTDDTPWAIKPTPIPSSFKDGMAVPVPEALPVGQPGQLTGQPESAAMPDAPGQPQMPPMPGMPADGALGMPGGGAPGAQAMPAPPKPKSPLEQFQERVAQEHAKAKAAADGATKQIEDWLVQSQWHAEVRKLIEDCARLGTGVLKGPTPHRVKSRMVRQGEMGMELVMEESIAPESRAVSPWRLYPDPACGECIQDGSYVWEQDTITAKALRDLKGLPGYLDEQIDKVLEQGPDSKHHEVGYTYQTARVTDADLFEIWYFYGTAEREDLEAAGVEIPDDGDVAVPCLVTMVNDVVIKAALNPLDSGDFPYDVMPWQRKQDQPWGTGVAMQINTPQRMLTAAARNLMDNAGLSAGPQIVLRREAIRPADGKWEITPRKIWWVEDGADVQAVNQAFMVVNIPTLQQELNNIIQFAMKMAEDVTGLPMLMQGQANAKVPDTVGGMQLLNNNASTVLRRIARLFDDRVTEPHIRRYYEWLMAYGEEDSIKGDFQIDARGSTALIDRDLQNQSIMQMGSLVGNPAFGIDPEKWFAEALKAQRLDPKRFVMDEEKKAAMSSKPPPAPPQIEVAKIRAEADAQKTMAQLQAESQRVQAEMQAQMQLAQMARQTELEKAQMANASAVEKMRIDTDRDAVYVQAQSQRDQTNASAKMAELALKRELAMLEYANKREMTLEQVKAKLADTAMKLQTTKELAGLKATAEQLPTPPVEPPGRAPTGESFQK